MDLNVVSLFIAGTTAIVYGNQVDIRGDTPLHRAMHNKKSHFEQSISRASEQDLSRKNKSGSTPLMSAVIWGNRKAVRRLLEKGTRQVNSVDKYGRTPLHYAAWLGLYDITSMLLRHGALSYIKDNFSLTPIDIALSRRSKEHTFVTLLVMLNGGSQEFEMIDFSESDTDSSE